MHPVHSHSLGGANCVNRTVGASDVLADPTVQALMTADRVDPSSLAAMMRRMAARLRPHGERT